MIDLLLVALLVAILWLVIWIAFPRKTQRRRNHGGR